MTDISLNKDKEYYDFNFINGDFELTQGMETALLMSIFCEKRAGVSEIPAPELRRGWWGNLVNGYDNYEIGSKLWLLEQARRDNTTLNLAKTYAQDCLQWLIDDGYAKEIITDTSFVVGGIEIDMQIVTSANKTINRSYQLWSNTNI